MLRVWFQFLHLSFSIRMVLVLLVVLSVHATFLVEQPHGSLLPRHPRWEWFTNTICRATRLSYELGLVCAFEFFIWSPGGQDNNVDGPPWRGVSQTDHAIQPHVDTEHVGQGHPQKSRAGEKKTTNNSHLWLKQLLEQMAN